VAMVKNSIVRHRTDGSLVRPPSPIYGSVKETSDLLVGCIAPCTSVRAAICPTEGERPNGGVS
jgi:hypothetical protein